MKHPFYIFAIACFAVMLQACDSTHTVIVDPTITPLSKDTIIIGTGDEPGEFLCNKDYDDDEAGFFMPPSYLTLVRFADSDMTAKVIVQHPFKKIEEKGLNHWK